MIFGCACEDINRRVAILRPRMDPTKSIILNTKLIILYTKFLVFGTDSLVFGSKLHHLYPRQVRRGQQQHAGNTLPLTKAVDDLVQHGEPPRHLVAPKSHHFSRGENLHFLVKKTSFVF